MIEDERGKKDRLFKRKILVSSVRRLKGHICKMYGYRSYKLSGKDANQQNVKYNGHTLSLYTFVSPRPSPELVQGRMTKYIGNHKNGERYVFIIVTIRFIVTIRTIDCFALFVTTI